MGALALRRLSLPLLAAPAAAAAHAPGPGADWSFEPWVVAALALALAGYVIGLARLWRHAGHGRGIGAAQVAAFSGGWLVLALALVSPLDALGTRLFAAHMVQHELLMVVAAPLLVLGRPLALWAWALPAAARRQVGTALRHRAWRGPWQVLTAPLAAWIVHAATLWLWHLPAWFEAALADEGVHAAQHLSFLFGALLFWWSALGPAGRPAQGVALLSIFTTMLHTGALGALLALAATAWYPSYAASAAALGWDALQDQQLGGLVMWAPAGLAYLAAGLVVAARWMSPPRVGLTVR